MGVYYGVCCKGCEVCLSFGKKIAKGDRLFLQGILSEREGGGLMGSGRGLHFKLFCKSTKGTRSYLKAMPNFPRCSILIGICLRIY